MPTNHILAMNNETTDGQEEEAAWPFPHVPPALYWTLSEADRAGLEQIIRDILEKTNSKH